MEHRRVDQLRSVADIRPAAMSRGERLERWAELLECQPTRRLQTLPEIEFMPRAERPLLRADNSPLSVAFADPVLRAEGLASDRFGDAMTFFELSEHDAHLVLCSCMNGQTIEASRVAGRVRAMANRSTASVLAGYLVVGAAVATPMLMVLLY